MAATQQLVFGNGGGFTGKVTQYTLYANGKLFLDDPLTNQSKQVNSLSKKETAELFKEVQQLNLSALHFSHPGNLYYFIQLKDQETKQEITWGDAEHPVPSSVQQVYDKLKATLPKSE